MITGMSKARIVMKVAILALSANVVFGQISQGGYPYSFKSDIRLGEDIDSIPVIRMPEIRKTALDSIIQNNQLFGESQFAYDFTVDIDVKESARVDSIDIGLLYRLAIHSDNAKSINLIFDNYELPHGAKLYLYSVDKQYVLGAFTSNNNKQSKKLPTLPVKGDKIIIEYFEPFFPDCKAQLVIGKVNHDFLGINYVEEISDDSIQRFLCEVDVNCSPEGDLWQTEKRAVCKILINGKDFCSGVLLNNTSFDGTPYILTAKHCVSSQNEADNCVFIFNYEKPYCNSGKASEKQSISSGFLRATNSQSDFTLIELSHKPMSSWNPYYAGWDRNDSQGLGGVGIHHPNGDVKKISTHSMTPITSDCLPVNIQNNFYLINEWIATANGHGVTEGGSSGSPLFNNAHRVIGQLHGGCVGHNDDCWNPSNDYSNYGKIFASWDIGGTSNGQLKDWLDPANTGVLSLSGANVCSQDIGENVHVSHTVGSGVVENIQATSNITSTSTIKTNAVVEYRAGEEIVLQSGFYAENGSAFYAKVEPFDCVPGCHPMTLHIINTYFSGGGNLCFNQNNADSYHFKLLTTSGALAFQTTGTVSASQICVPVPSNLASGVYYVTLTLYSDCEELSETYSVIKIGNKSAELNNTENNNAYDNDVLLYNDSEKKADVLDFNIYPNPNGGEFTIEINSAVHQPYSIIIVSSKGEVIFKAHQLIEKTIKVDKKIVSSAGVYFISMSDETNVVTKKVIVQQKNN